MVIGKLPEILKSYKVDDKSEKHEKIVTSLYIPIPHAEGTLFYIAQDVAKKHDIKLGSHNSSRGEDDPGENYPTFESSVVNGKETLAKRKLGRAWTEYDSRIKDLIEFSSVGLAAQR
ncbi:MAG: hypothetical protein V1678_05020 [Candidatus Aenigmatarchaeota archaeon]